MAEINITDMRVNYPVRLGGRERSTMAALAATASFGRIASDMKKLSEVEAIRGINLHVKSGDRLAIIGRNGAGKSTLLKTMAGIIMPKQGHIHIDGDTLSLLTLNAGTNHQLTARENLKMIAHLLGIPNSDLPAYMEDVYDFTELGEFFDMPLSTYSSGMLVRFMFGAMTYKSSDILIVDEIIGAGDSVFFRKAQERARNIFKKSKILVLSTHSPEITFELCNRAILMVQGKIYMDDTPENVRKMYEKFNR